MAGLTSATAKSSAYVGIDRIFEFVNADGRQTKWNCGQAAATTLLAHHGVLSLPDKNAEEAMRDVEFAFPPDQLGGWLGSSRRRVWQICKAHGLKLKEVRGEDSLRAELSRGNPVVVMMGVAAGHFWRWDVPGGHWMVAYGFDDDAVHLTNWSEPMPWAEFRSRWRSLVTRLIQMNERGLTVNSIAMRRGEATRPR